MNIYCEAFGCSLNRGESKEMLEGALALGHSLVPAPASADVIVLDTCVVIQATDNRMLARLKEIGKMEIPLIVAGCLPAVAPRRVLDICPGAILVPPGHRDSFMKILSALKTKSGGENEEAGMCHGPKAGVVEEVPIASGCRGDCTYCIARLARGDLRSRSPDEIMERVRSLVGRGCREVRLTAQDSGLYGLDTGEDICGLLRRVCALEGKFRVRLGMMNPDSLRPVFDGLMTAYGHPNMFRFLHVPVQSGDDDILEKMGRNYCVADFLDLAGMYRGHFPSGLLATDIIVGFPGERDAQFEKTLELLLNAQPDMVNVKAFSPRPGTPAAGYPGKTARDVVRVRMKMLNDLRRRISLENNRVLEGRTEHVLVTERARGGVLARTIDYRPVLLRDNVPLGIFREVVLDEARPGYVVGKLVT
jgi:MiaB-like tRNA modifying enzyme